MNLVEQIRVLIIKTIIKLNFEIDTKSIDFVIEIPKDSKNGDYASNVALQLGKMLKANPRFLADQIAQAIDLDKTNLSHIEVAGPGFINFFLKTESIATIIDKILAEDKIYGRSTFGQGKNYNVEFVSANPTGRLHLGHARQAALGDSICRILTAAGYKVTREYYLNDAGNQIHNLTLSLQARYNVLCGLPLSLPEDGYYGEDIVNIAKKIFQQVGAKYVNDNSKATYQYFRNVAIQAELDQIKQDLADYRVKMDIFSSETAIRERGMIEQTLEILKDIGATYIGEGATWFNSTAYGDDKDRVLIRSDGSYTYIVPDIAYHIDKLQRGYDNLIDIFGADHHGYIKRLKASIKALGYDDTKLEVLIVQMVRLIKDGAEFKMSKRSGNAISLAELCAEVGVDAARYFFVARSASTHLDFDIGLAKSYSNDNPVYYAQYAHARMCSILAAANKDLKELPTITTYQLLITANEVNLMKQLGEFASIINESAATKEPYKIANYIQRVAQLFHSFYNECRVIDPNELELSVQRLQLVKATKIVLANALELIGVSAPEKM